MTTRQTTVKLGSNDAEHFWVLLDSDGKALLSRGGFDSSIASKKDCNQCAYLMGGNFVFEDLTDDQEPEPEVSTTATATELDPAAALEPFDGDTGEVLSTTATDEAEKKAEKKRIAAEKRAEKKRQKERDEDS